MSFYDQYHQEVTGETDKVAGPGTPHHDAQHHEQPEPPKLTGRVVNGPDGKEVKESE